MRGVDNFMENKIEETNDEFFKKADKTEKTCDLGTVTLHNNNEVELLVKYLQELADGNETYRPSDVLKFEKQTGVNL